MKIEIVRKMKANKYVYDLYGREIGEANYTYSILPDRIKVFGENDDKDSVIALKQTNWLFNIIDILPWDFKKLMPYKCYVDGKYSGKSEKTLFRAIYKFTISDNEYELCEHSNNYVSLLKNNVQIALYQKDAETFAEQNLYRIEYTDDDSVINLSELYLFCIFIDRVFFKNTNGLYYARYEKTYVINDKYSDRAKWSPYR